MVTGKEKDNISKVSLRSNIGEMIMPEGSEINGDLQKNSTMPIELELLLLLQRRGLPIERERDFNISRSGSAPPTVDGALCAAGSLHGNPNFALLESEGSDSNGALMGEEEIRSHPAYLAYYYSNENSNPRLPPPLLSREDWRVAQRIQGGGYTMGVMGKWRNNHLVNDNVSSSLFSMQPKIPIQKADTQPIELRKTAVKNLSRKNSTESVAALGVPQKSEMGVRRKSFADIVQEGRGQSSTSSGQFSCSSSHNSFPKVLDTADIVNTSSTDSQEKEESSEALYYPQLGSGFYGGLAFPNSFSAAGSSSIKISPSEPHQTLRFPPGFPVVRTPDSVDGHENIAHSNSHDPSSGKTQISDILTSFPGLSLSKDQVNQSTLLQSAIETGLPNAHIHNMQQQFNKSRADKNGPSHIGFTREIGVAPDVNYINFDRQVNLPRRTSSSVNLRSLANSSDFSVLQGPKIKYQGSHPTGYILNGQSQRSDSYGCSNLHSPDAQHDEVLEQSTSYISQEAAMLRNLSQGRNYIGTSHDFFDLLDLERVYFEALLGQQKKQFPLSYQYNGNLTVGTRMAHNGNPMVNSIHSAIRPEYQYQNKQSSHFNTFKVQVGGSFGSCKTASGTTAESKSSSSLLEELKNNKSKSLELLDVLDQVVEFSMDQCGSRFIQQKMEIATIEDKMKIFPRILPHVRALMTDVFGNYVIQKFFEHGTEGQRKELSSQLLGHVLPLSLQMYGCRVIQKALEVVDVEQQIQMVTELNGSVMKCVRDQNGSHVIQKCIECVPQDRIEFIISSLFGQIVALSMHPYGCRVIQRVLEHCNDPNTQQIIMGEIIKSVCTLAQDQYGNYVIQHVLQHGKPHEKAEIVAKVAGHVVKMSQQKFASNVVEKCLTFCGPEERRILINEMLGSTDENEALQAMMKDPFGNYVVQKVLETCDNQSRELIISRIKVHLNTLKRYTYGQHIVSRIEKLIETGEKHREVKT